MKRSLSAATGLLITVPVVVAMPAHASDTPAGPAPPRIVADELNNPRQLNWSADGRILIVAEAGRGATTPEDCTGEGEEQVCLGATGSITEIFRPHRTEPFVERVVEGLPSVAGPNGAFAAGTNGADDLPGEDGVYVVAQSPGLAAEPTHADSNQGAYIVANGEDAPPAGEDEGELPVFVELVGGDIAFLAKDLLEAERALNPDTAQVESNPYAILFVEEDPANDEDGYALVADAGANAVWKLAPNHEAATPEEFITVTVFAAFPPVEEAEGEEGPPEFVPTSLAMDKSGHFFVGGLGSEVPGAAQVVEFDANGKEIDRWTGFTGVTGVAVDDDNIYVSQLFGSTPPPPPGEGMEEAPPTYIPGSVIMTSRHDTTSPRFEVMVPLPGDLETDHHGNLYVVANSVAPAGGVENVFGPGSPNLGGGQVWELDFKDAPVQLPPVFPEPPPPVDGGPIGMPGDGGPVGTDGQWVDVEPSYYEPFSGAACGTNVTVAAGDVREVEVRVTVLPDGSVLTEYRGAGTVDVSRDSDGAFIDELDISGEGFDLSSKPTEDGEVVVTVALNGRSIVLPFDEVQAQALRDAGLPEFLFWAGGTISFQDVLQLSDDENTPPSSVTSTVLLNTATGVADVCKLLDAAGAPMTPVPPVTPPVTPPAEPTAPETPDLAGLPTSLTALAPAEDAGAELECPEGVLCSHEGFFMYDVDGDGQYDPFVLDTTSANGLPNGILDMNIVSIGGFLAALIDYDENSLHEAVYVDITGNGVFDTIMYTVQGSGEVYWTEYVNGEFAQTPTLAVPTGGLALEITPAPVTPGDLLQAGLTDPCAFYNGVAFSGSNVSCDYR